MPAWNKICQYLDDTLGGKKDFPEDIIVIIFALP